MGLPGWGPSSGEAILGGLQAGQKMMLTAQSAQDERNQQEIVNELKMADAAGTIGANKNLPMKMRAQAITKGLTPFMKRMGVEMEPVTIQNIGRYEPAIIKVNALQEDYKKNPKKYTPQTFATGVKGIFTEALQGIDDETGAEKVIRDLSVGDAEDQLKHSQAMELAKEKAANAAKVAKEKADIVTPEEALKRTSDVHGKIATLTKRSEMEAILATTNPQQAEAFGKTDPAVLETTYKAYANELNTYAKHLGKPQNNVSPGEAETIVKIQMAKNPNLTREQILSQLIIAGKPMAQAPTPQAGNLPPPR